MDTRSDSTRPERRDGFVDGTANPDTQPNSLDYGRDVPFDWERGTRAPDGSMIIGNPLDF